MTQGSGGAGRSGPLGGGDAGLAGTLASGIHVQAAAGPQLGPGLGSQALREPSRPHQETLAAYTLHRNHRNPYGIT